MTQPCTSQLIHCVFSTKGRLNIIPDELRSEFHSLIGGIADECDMKAVAVGGTANHVHLLLSLPATKNLPEAIQCIKSGSSQWFREKTGRHFQWQESYGVFSVSISQLAETIEYINAQAGHHGDGGFEAEFRCFLKRHGIALDDNSIFG